MSQDRRGSITATGAKLLAAVVLGYLMAAFVGVSIAAVAFLVTTLLGRTPPLTAGLAAMVGAGVATLVEAELEAGLSFAQDRPVANRLAQVAAVVLMSVAIAELRIGPRPSAIRPAPEFIVRWRLLAAAGVMVAAPAALWVLLDSTRLGADLATASSRFDDGLSYQAAVQGVDPEDAASGLTVALVAYGPWSAAGLGGAGIGLATATLWLWSRRYQSRLAEVAAIVAPSTVAVAFDIDAGEALAMGMLGAGVLAASAARSSSRWIAGGLLLGVSVLAHPAALPGALLALIGLSCEPPRLWLRPALAVTATGLVLVPWTRFVSAATGRAVIDVIRAQPAVAITLPAISVSASAHAVRYLRRRRRPRGAI